MLSRFVAEVTSIKLERLQFNPNFDSKFLRLSPLFYSEINALPTQVGWQLGLKCQIVDININFRWMANIWYQYQFQMNGKYLISISFQMNGKYLISISISDEWQPKLDGDPGGTQVSRIFHSCPRPLGSLSAGAITLSNNNIR